MYQKYWKASPKIFEKMKKEKTLKEDGMEYKEIKVDVNSLIKDLSSEMNPSERKIFKYKPPR